MEISQETKMVIVFVILVCLVVSIAIVIQKGDGIFTRKVLLLEQVNTTGWSQDRIDELEVNLSIQNRLGILMYVEE